MANLLRKGDRTEPAAPSPTKRSEPSASNATQPKKSDSAAGNPRNSSQVWIEGICKEEATRKQWQEMYGWMADYDPRGNLKTRKAAVDNSTRFSNTLPNSRGHDYGWHLQSEVGQQIRAMQTSFDNQHKKRVPTAGLGSE